MKITNRVTLNGENVGYAVSYDESTPLIAFTTRSLYSLAQMLSEEGYAFYDFNGDIEDPDGESICNLPAIEWNNSNFEEYNTYEDSVLEGECVVESMVVKYFRDRKVSTFELDKLKNPKITTREKLLEYISDIHSLYTNYGTTVDHLPLNFCASRDVLFTHKELSVGKDAYNKILDVDENSSDDDIERARKIKEKFSEEIKAYEAYMKLASMRKFSSMVELMLTIKNLETKTGRTILKNNIIDRDEFLNAITTYGIPNIRTENVIKVYTAPELSIDLSTGTLVNKTITKDVVGLTTTSRATITENGSYSSFDLKSSAVSDLSLLTSSANKSEYERESIRKGSKYTALHFLEKVTRFAVYIDTVEDGITYTTMVTLDGEVTFVKSTSAIIGGAPGYELGILGLGTYALNEVIDLRRVLRLITATAYSGTLIEKSAGKASKVEFSSSIDLMYKLGLFSETALYFAGKLVAFDIESNKLKTMSKSNFETYGDMSQAAYYYTLGFEGLQNEATAKEVVPYLAEFYDRTDQDLTPVERFVEAVVMAHDEDFIPWCEGTINDVDKIALLDQMWNEPNRILFSILWCSSVLSGNLSVGEMAEGEFKDQRSKSSDLIEVIKVYLKHNCNESLPLREYIKELIRAADEVTSTDVVGNLEMLIVPPIHTYLGTRMDFQSISARFIESNQFFVVTHVLKEVSNKPMVERRDYGVVGKLIPRSRLYIESLLGEIDYTFRQAYDDNNLVLWVDGEEKEYEGIPQATYLEIKNDLRNIAYKVLLELMSCEMDVYELARKVDDGLISNKELEENESIFGIDDYGNIFIKVPVTLNIDKDKKYLRVILSIDILNNITTAIKNSVDQFVTLADLIDCSFTLDGDIGITVINALVTPWGIMPKGNQKPFKAYSVLPQIMSNTELAELMGITVEEFENKYDIDTLRIPDVNILKLQSESSYFGITSDDREAIEVMMSDVVESEEELDNILDIYQTEPIDMYVDRWRSHVKMSSGTIQEMRTFSDKLYSMYSNVYDECLLENTYAEESNIWLEDLNSVQVGYDSSRLLSVDKNKGVVSVLIDKAGDFCYQLLETYVDTAIGDIDEKISAAEELARIEGLPLTGTPAYVYYMTKTFSFDFIQEHSDLFKKINRYVVKPGVGSLVIQRVGLERRVS